MSGIVWLTYDSRVHDRFAVSGIAAQTWHANIGCQCAAVGWPVAVTTLRWFRERTAVPKPVPKPAPNYADFRGCSPTCVCIE
jgi:hypothetical protein